MVGVLKQGENTYTKKPMDGIESANKKKKLPVAVRVLLSMGKRYFTLCRRVDSATDKETRKYSFVHK